MKRSIVFLSFFSIIIFCVTNLNAKIVVESVKGEAAYKAGKQWLPLAKGQTLPEGTKISTGVKSWAVLNIDGDSLRIEQLTMMKIFKNQTNANNKNTHIGLKHGGLKARISKIGTLKTSFKITTPVATSSVRGTDEDNRQGAKSGNRVHFPAGIGEIRDRNGHTYLVQGNSLFHIGPNDPRPRNMLFGEKGKSLILISDPNSTGDEKDSTEFSGLDNFNQNDNPADQNSLKSPANVILQVGW